MGEVIISDKEAGLRLDRWCRAHAPVPYGMVQRALRKGGVKVNGKKQEASYRLNEGDIIRTPQSWEGGVPVASRPKEKPVMTNKDRQWLESHILFEDEEVLLINKPAGVAVQGGSKVSRSLDAMLVAYAGGEESPKLVHRLDKDTSGMLLFARTADAARMLTRVFREHTMEKQYLALTVGVPKEQRGRSKWSMIDLPIAKGSEGGAKEKMQVDPKHGKEARTRYRVLDAKDGIALVELEPITGRTHQLRVHLAAIGCPILGDGKYGGKQAFAASMPEAKQLHLHAYGLAIPREKGKTLRLKAPLPEHMVLSLEQAGLRHGGE